MLFVNYKIYVIMLSVSADNRGGIVRVA